MTKKQTIINKLRQLKNLHQLHMNLIVIIFVRLFIEFLMKLLSRYN